MVRRFTIVGVLVLLAALVALQFFQGSSGPTVFASLDFDKAQAQAQSASPRKLLVVDFVAAGTPAARDLHQQTWSNPELVNWIRAHAIAVQVDADKDKGRLRGLGVQSVPAVVLLDGTKVLVKIEGVQSARTLLVRFTAAAPSGLVELGRAGGPGRATEKPAVPSAASATPPASDSRP